LLADLSSISAGATVKNPLCLPRIDAAEQDAFPLHKLFRGSRKTYSASLSMKAQVGLKEYATLVPRRVFVIHPGG